MKENELMIGDWVYIEDAEQKDGLSKTKVVCITEDNTDWLSPIPLTEEIMKLNGWWNDPEDSEVRKCMFSRYRDFVLTYATYGGLPVLTIEQDNLMEHRISVQLVDEVYNVHELQHALRLCGLTELADNFKLN